jgi:tetratricopeptide (TPR) repeat protein
MRRHRERPQLSPSGIAHLWEHACLLYHSYEWQSAVGAFSQLDHCTSDLGDRCIFALNRGLIEARLGDFELALGSFANALAFEENNPVAHFLLGLVYAELGNYDKGRKHSEHCLDCMGSTSLDHWTRINSFSLDRLAVEENINRLRSAAEVRSAGSDHIKPVKVCLHTIPANVLFEPPPKSGHASQDNSQSNSGLTTNTRLHNGSFEHFREPISRAAQPIEVAGPDISSLHLIEDTDMNLTTAPTNGTLDDRRKHKRLVPRDAQVRDGSMRDLTQFLRHAGPSGSANVTVDRSYMQRLLQRNNTGGQQAPDFLSRASTTSSTTPPSTPRRRQGDDFDSLLELYCAARARRRPISAAIDSSVSEVATTMRQVARPEQTMTEMAVFAPVAHTKRPSRSRRPTLEKAQRWLRKEVRPPWPVSKQASQKRPARDQSSGALSNDDRDVQSLPSVVSSTEMFTFGRSGRNQRSHS